MSRPRSHVKSRTISILRLPYQSNTWPYCSPEVIPHYIHGYVLPFLGSEQDIILLPSIPWYIIYLFATVVAECSFSGYVSAGIFSVSLSLSLYPWDPLIEQACICGGTSWPDHQLLWTIAYKISIILMAITMYLFINTSRAKAMVGIT